MRKEAGKQPNETSKQYAERILKQFGLHIVREEQYVSNPNIIEVFFKNGNCDVNITFNTLKDQIWCASIFKYKDETRTGGIFKYKSIDNALFDKHIDSILVDITLFILK